VLRSLVNGPRRQAERWRQYPYPFVYAPERRCFRPEDCASAARAASALAAAALEARLRNRRRARPERADPHEVCPSGGVFALPSEIIVTAAQHTRTTCLATRCRRDQACRPRRARPLTRTRRTSFSLPQPDRGEDGVDDEGLVVRCAARGRLTINSNLRTEQEPPRPEPRAPTVAAAQGRVEDVGIIEDD